jgi:hypothetical protein
MKKSNFKNYQRGPKQEPHRWKVGLAIVLVFVGYGIVGRMDYEDALLAQEAPKVKPTMVAAQAQECAK